MRRLAVRYGIERSQIGELWHPGGEAPFPTVVLVHGGFWRAAATKRLMRPLAAALSSEGFAVWNIEYRRTGAGGGGGGWPATFEDVAGAVDHLARIPGVRTDRVLTCGHSAGGHLALWAAGRHRLPDGAPGSAPALRPCAAISLAGVADLEAADRDGLGRGAVAALLGDGAAIRAERYPLTSPRALLPLGVPQVLIHGTADVTVPTGQSAGYAAAARAAGDDVRLITLPDADHRAVTRRHGAAWSALRSEVHRLLD